ncbi:MAG: molybdopterin converting factor [Gammaproteobacteria bacterium SG8_11]|nr:MAG: molybdopterin converting factor [Gammaproteobacteria bacterium SG8_11]
MTVVVKFFASLRESLALDEGSVILDSASTVADVWQQATRGAAMPPNTLMAVNAEYVNQTHPVKDGDEVAFFPPVSGG